MKVFIVTALLFLAAAESLHAQNYGGQYYQTTPQDGSNPYQRQIYERKVRTYTKMKHWGIGLLAGGGFAVVTGIVLVAVNPPDNTTVNNNYNNNYYYNYNNNATTTDNPNGAWVAGVLLIETGAFAVIPGIILTAIGAKKVNQYKTKLSGLSLGLAPKGKGLSLTYTF